MCRYAMHGPYKRHFACFTCRKAFKQPPMGDWFAARGQASLHKWADLAAEYWAAVRSCPHCREPMADMGLDFKAPPQADEKAWRILQGMFRIGHAFQTCGCTGPGFIPVAVHDYRAYLVQRRQDYAEQLERAQQSATMSPADKHEAGDYWQERIARIDQELKALA